MRVFDEYRRVVRVERSSEMTRAPSFAGTARKHGRDCFVDINRPRAARLIHRMQKNAYCAGNAVSMAQNCVRRGVTIGGAGEIQGTSTTWFDG